MAQEEKIKRYDEALERAKKLQETCDSQAVVGWCEYLFPELKESRPNGCIVLEDFNGGEGFYKLNLDYLNEKQVEEIEEMVRTWNKESKTSNENIKNCIGMCLTDVNEQRFKDYNTNLRDCLAWLEKQDTERTQLYVRFGDIPSNEKSKIYHGEDEIGDENGVSVYPAFELNGNIVLGLTLPITKTTLYTQQHLLEYDNRPCYLVSGDYVGKGTDGEPLIKNISVIKRLDNYRIKECEKKSVIEMKTPEESLGIDSATYNKIVDECIYGENKPKFHEGEWIVSDYTNMAYIESIDEKNYHLRLKSGYHEKMSINYVDKNWHLWTIDDANEGDVLFYDDGWTCIFKHIHGIWYSSYCFITADGEFHTGYERHAVDAKINGNANPATKEQRDLLFAKMKEAGYEWDADKKELKKADVELTDFEKSLKHIMIETLECGDTHNLKADAEMLLRFAQKPAEWSEEDDWIKTKIIKVLLGCETFLTSKETNECIDWIKSIKQRLKGKL